MTSRITTWRKIRSTLLLVVFLVLVMMVLTGASNGGVGQWELLITLVVLVAGLVVIWRPRKPAG
jgi:hypothetical protein